MRRENRIGLWCQAFENGNAGKLCDHIIKNQPVPDRLFARLTVERPPKLGKAEIDVLRLYAHGLKERAVAEERGTSRHTIHRQVRDAQRKLGARNLTHTVVIAMRMGLIE